MVLSTKYGRTQCCHAMSEAINGWHAEGWELPPAWVTKLDIKEVFDSFQNHSKNFSQYDWKVSHTNKVQKLLLF